MYIHLQIALLWSAEFWFLINLTFYTCNLSGQPKTKDCVQTWSRKKRVTNWLKFYLCNLQHQHLSRLCLHNQTCHLLSPSPVPFTCLIVFQWPSPDSMSLWWVVTLTSTSAVLCDDPHRPQSLCSDPHRTQCLCGEWWPSLAPVLCCVMILDPHCLSVTLTGLNVFVVSGDPH